jgi:hypothetical protein
MKVQHRPANKKPGLSRASLINESLKTYFTTTSRAFKRSIQINELKALQ